MFVFFCDTYVVRRDCGRAGRGGGGVAVCLYIQKRGSVGSNWNSVLIFKVYTDKVFRSVINSGTACSMQNKYVVHSVQRCAFAVLGSNVIKWMGNFVVIIESYHISHYCIFRWLLGSIDQLFHVCIRVAQVSHSLDEWNHGTRVSRFIYPAQGWRSYIWVTIPFTYVTSCSWACIMHTLNTSDGVRVRQVVWRALIPSIYIFASFASFLYCLSSFKSGTPARVGRERKSKAWPSDYDKQYHVTPWKQQYSLWPPTRL